MALKKTNRIREVSSIVEENKKFHTDTHMWI